MSEEKGSMPDLSRIIEMILANPDLVAQIANLGKSDPQPTNAPDASTEAAPVTVETNEPISLYTPPPPHDKRRAQLLSAMKPYLSESRARAVDSMLTFGEIFDLMRSKK